MAYLATIVHEYVSLSSFAIPFPYISKDHVSMCINDVETDQYEWTSNTTIAFLDEFRPDAGDIVTIKRETPTTPLVDYQDGQSFSSADMDMATLQTLYVAQELMDRTIQLTAGATSFEGRGFRLSGLHDPVEDQDAVTKSWASNIGEGSLNACIEAASEATAAADEATELLETFGGTGYRFVFVAKDSSTDSTYAAAAGDYVCYDTTTAAATVTLPSEPRENDVVAVCDIGGNFQSYPVTVGRNSLLINGSGSDYILSGSNAVTMFRYTGNSYGWKVEYYGSAVAHSHAGLLPTGSVIWYLTEDDTVIPDGYVVADGSSLNKTTYAALYSVIGSMYGGGTATFVLPDLRGEFIRGYDGGRGIDADRVLGSSQGFAMEDITGEMIMKQLSPTGRIIMSASGAFSVVTTTTTASSVAYGAVDYPTSAVQFNASNVVTTATETRPRNVALIPLMKY